MRKKEYVVTPENRENADIGTNRIIGELPETDSNFKIVFRGERNILYLQKGVSRLFDANITFNGNGAIAFFRRNRYAIAANIELKSGSTFFLGRNVYTNPSYLLDAKVGRKRILYIGDDSLLSLRIRMYALGRKGDILIGGHVWIGQNVEILGSSTIGNCAILGAESTVNGEHIPDNTCWASRKGKLKKIRENVIFDKKSIRDTSRSGAVRFECLNPDWAGYLLSFAKKDRIGAAKEIRKQSDPDKRLELILNHMEEIKYHARTWIPPENINWEEPERTEEENNIIGNYIDDGNVNISFRGKGNRIIIEDGTILKNCSFDFRGDNSLLYIRKSDTPLSFNGSIHTDTTLFIDKYMSTHQDGLRLTLSPSEAMNIVIGKNCIFGKGAWVRTSDQHGMFDIDTLKRLNPPASVLIGCNSIIEDGRLIRKGSRVNLSNEDRHLSDLLSALDETIDMEERIGLIEEAIKKS